MTRKINKITIFLERAVLGTCLRDSKNLPELLEPSDFVEPKHQDIAHCIRLMCASGVAVDEASVTVELRNKGSKVDAFYVSDMVTECGYTPMNQAWSDEVKRQSRLRQIKEVVEKISELSEDDSCIPEQIIDFAFNKFNSVGKSSVRNKPKPLSHDELFNFNRSDDPNTVLGNRWLCKGGSALIVSQSGVGKSSLLMQAAVNWSVGGRKDFFGIKAIKPLRVLVIQAENDFGDVAEAYQDVVKGAGLFSDELFHMKDNLAIYRDSTSVGEDFPPMLRELIKDHRADLVFIDPVLSFAGIDIANQEQASKFLRHGINRVLVETQAVMIAMHHTTKPSSSKDKDKQTVSDMAYSGAGSAEFVNYFREVAVLSRQQGEQPIFKFGLTKRRGRAGMKNYYGEFAGEIMIRHSRALGQIRWEYATPEDLSPPTEGDASTGNDKGSRRRFKW